MESLPLILQAGLLLLGCALSRHLWDTNTTVGSVIIGVTSFGVLSFLFIVVAGVASASCPYQTPAVHILRHIPHIFGMLRSVVFLRIEASVCYYWLSSDIGLFKTHNFLRAVRSLLTTIICLPFLLLLDILLVTTLIIADFTKFVDSLFQESEQETVVLVLHSIA